MPRFTRNYYQLPIYAEALGAIVTDNDSHQGAYAGSIDYAVPVGTIVLAAASGTVVRVRDDTSSYGTDPRFGPDANYITIHHTHNELSEYLHLAKGSARVAVGDKVTIGQPIAYTGLSGWLYAPHLHFMVYKDPAVVSVFQCLEVRFRSTEKDRH